MHFAGFKDPSEFNSVRSFGEMGVDSMIGIEMKHLLESTCEINLSMKEIQDMKIEDVKALLEKAESEKKNLSTALVSTSSVKLPKNAVHSETVIRLNEVQNGVPVFLFDIDCDNISNLKSLAAVINHPVYGLVWSKEVEGTNVESLSSWYLEVRVSLIVINRAIIKYKSAYFKISKHTIGQKTCFH